MGMIFIKEQQDTAGEEKFHALAPLFYRDADGAVLVFDLSRRETFNLIEKWFSELQNHAVSIQIILVGNKCDKYPLQVTNDEAIAMADKYGVPFLSVSALNGVNIQDIFTTLSLKIMEYKEKNLPTIKPTKRKSIKLNENAPKKEDKGCCQIVEVNHLIKLNILYTNCFKLFNQLTSLTVNANILRVL